MEPSNHYIHAITTGFLQYHHLKILNRNLILLFLCMEIIFEHFHRKHCSNYNWKKV